MTVQRRLAIATRGYRGDIGARYYISEEFSFSQENDFGIDIFEEVSLATIDEVGIIVSSVEEIGVSIDTISVETVSIEIDQDSTSVTL